MTIDTKALREGTAADLTAAAPALLDEVERLRFEVIAARAEENGARDALHASEGRWRRAEAEVERLRAVVVALLNTHDQHAYQGRCPDDVEGWDSRDPECPACAALVAASAVLEVTP